MATRKSNAIERRTNQSVQGERKEPVSAQTCTRSASKTGRERARMAVTVEPAPVRKAATVRKAEHAQMQLSLLPTTPAILAPTPAKPRRRSASGKGKASVRQRFGELRTALADGWEIVQPIFARPLWSSTDDAATAYNFVLRRDLMTRLITVPDGRTVQRFIRDRQLVVDYRR
jgi:hypothetical protein